MDTSKYRYKPLVGNEIRLIHLLPGRFEDELSLEIFHTPLLTPPEPEKGARLTRDELQDAVREADWEVYETPEGRAFFLSMESLYTSHVYEYPGPELQPESYAPRVTATHPGQQFEALSYVWGVAENARKVRVLDGDASGERDIFCLEVWPNLELALRHLRLEDKCRTLWIDAVCINQEDLEERAVQVKRMDKIYTLASRVIVWLGPASPVSGKGLRLLEYLGQQVEVATDLGTFPAVDAHEERWFDDGVELPYDASEWAAIRDVCRRPWFERVWTMQEIALANPEAVFQCGSDSVRYYFLRRAFIALGFKHQKNAALLDLPLYNRMAIESGFGNMNLVSLAKLLVKTKCYDPRDKIYGALSMLGPKLRGAVAPSYEQPFEDVYRDVFMAYTNVTGRLDLLCNRMRSSLPFHGPSWVPDYRQRTEPPSCLWSQFTAAGFTKAEAFHDGHGVLTATGVLVSRIVKVHPPLDSAATEMASKLQQLWPSVLGLPSEYPSGEDTITAWTRTICLDYHRDRYPNFRGEPHLLADMKAIFERFAAPTDDAEAEEILRELPEYEDIRETLQQMSFIQTDDGRFGLAHVNAQVGDQICVFLGCWAPIMLRPEASTSDTWQVVGETYLHGIMDSETILGPLGPEFTVQQHTVNAHCQPHYICPSKVTPGMFDLHNYDPRIGELPPEWEGWDIGNMNRDADYPVFPMYFHNVETDEWINYDPQLTPEKLRERGVSLSEFKIV